jgi:ornithine carbamoyltransferase
MNALSDLWHPTQILADLLTMHEHAHLLGPNATGEIPASGSRPGRTELPALPENLTITWVGDSTNILHDMLVAYPRLGMKVRVATPPQKAYQCPAPVWDRVLELGCEKGITWTNDPVEALHGADVVVTDTWFAISFLHK